MIINKIKNNLSKYMLWYTLLAIVGGIFLGHIWNMKFLSKYIIFVVFTIIYPMMINLSLSTLKRIRETQKPLIEAMILNFIYAPSLMWILTSLFINDPKIKMALMLLSIAPASSMGLGYIGLAEGHMLSGSIIVATAFILSIFVYPVFGHYLALGANIPVPLSLILKNLLLVLILPFILGIATREYIEKKYGIEKFNKVKPYFSSITLISLYVLIFFIFASKANLVLKNYTTILLLFPVAILFYGISIFFTLLVNKKLLSFEYGQHQAVVFTSVSKNIALTIAILTIFGKEGQYMAMFPAIMALFQAPFLMTYLKFSKRIKRWFEK